MRARNIKPSFFIDCDLSEVDFASRLLFIGLWCYADREGRFEWKPKQIKASIFPYDKVDIDKLLRNLISLHVITCHEGVGYVENFKKHQHPHPHEAKSALPEKHQLNQCHDMPLDVTECKDDVIIIDPLIPDSLIDDSTAKAVPAAGKPRQASRAKISDEEWLEEIKANPAYQGINFDVEIGKAQAWAMTNSRKCSRAFLLNWFNRAEKSVNITRSPPTNQPRKTFAQQKIDNTKSVMAEFMAQGGSNARIGQDEIHLGDGGNVRCLPS